MKRDVNDGKRWLKDLLIVVFIEKTEIQRERGEKEHC